MQWCTCGKANKNTFTSWVYPFWLLMKRQRSCQPLVLVLSTREYFSCLWNAEKVLLSWIFSLVFCFLKMGPRHYWIDNCTGSEFSYNWVGVTSSTDLQNTCTSSWGFAQFSQIMCTLAKVLWCRQVSWKMKAAGSCSWTLESLFCWPCSQNTQEGKDKTSEMFRVQPQWKAPPALRGGRVQGYRDCISQAV